MKSAARSLILGVLVFLCGSALAFGGEKLSGDTSSVFGTRYFVAEEFGPDGKATFWQMVRETVNLESGSVSHEVVLKTGDKQVAGYPLNAFWSVWAGKKPDGFVEATDEYPAFTKSRVSIMFMCAGWGGDKPGNVTGVCEYDPKTGSVSSIMIEGDSALHAVSGASSAIVYRVGNFRSPTISEKDAWGRFGTLFVFADCESGGVSTRCLIAKTPEYPEPRVMFLDGTNGWRIKFVEVDRKFVVEEIPPSFGHTVTFKVVREGNERPATAVILRNGDVAVHITETLIVK